VLELPEALIWANCWDLIPYNRVVSVAMKFYKERVWKHIRRGLGLTWRMWNEEHYCCWCFASPWDHKVIEWGWWGCGWVAVEEGGRWLCGSGLLVCELCEEPWKGKVVTLSADPQFHLIEGDDLKSKTEFVREMNWGMNTDFQNVFNLMLEVAVHGNLRPDQMIKSFFAFSDMEFGEVSINPWTSCAGLIKYSIFISFSGSTK